MGRSESFFSEIDIEFLIHELKTPVSVTETSLMTLLKKKDKFGGVTEKQEKILKRAIRNTKKIREMIYSMLETGKAEAGSFCRFDFKPYEVLYEVVMECIEASDMDLFEKIEKLESIREKIDLLAENGIVFKIEEKIKEATICQDKTKFRYIVSNIVRNALQYKKSLIEIGIEIFGDYIHIRVKDDGVGILPKHRENIFQRYKQLESDTSRRGRTSGHGLGLAGSLIMAKRLGGTIKVADIKGRGTLFTVILPVELKKQQMPYR